MLHKLIAGFLLFAAIAAGQSAPVSSVAQNRLAHLRRGINITGWFAQVYDSAGYTKKHFQTWITADDITLIKSAGFDHVRLSVNPQPIMDAEAGGGYAEYLGSLDAAVKMALDAGLAVELDMHPESEFKSHFSDNDFVERFTDFWRNLARHYSSWDANRLLFEIVDEPELQDPYRWAGIQAKLVAAIRQAAPQHTIIATGASWNNEGDLLTLEPVRDPNVIYVFHYYEPHIFTHQGATWGSYYWRWVKDLHYPSSPENAARVAESLPEAVDRLYVIRYGQDHWDAARIEAEINQAADWAQRNGVPLICNEFGVYREGGARSEDRVAWIRDVRTALERHNIGWAMWDYAGNFGVATKKNGKAMLDEATATALGLK